MDFDKNLLKAVSKLEDLKEAILHIKKCWKKNEKTNSVLNKEEGQAEKNNKIKYLGRQKIHDGVLTYILGPEKGGPIQYRMEVDLPKYVKKAEGCIRIVKVNKSDGSIQEVKGKMLNLKEAVDKIVEDYHAKKG